jgi:hypothetical protein
MTSFRRHCALSVLLALGGMSACTTTDHSPQDSTSAVGSSAAAKGEALAPDVTPAPNPPMVESAWTVRPDGVHGARIGMRAAEARTALGLPAAPAFAAGSCEYLDIATLPVRLAFMTESDTLVRIDVRDSTVTTAEGARIGDTEARIKELYGAGVVVTPHKYTGPVGHYLTVTPAGNTSHLIVFETDGQRVTTWRVGRKPAVEYVEGCA